MARSRKAGHPSSASCTRGGCTNESASTREKHLRTEAARDSDGQHKIAGSKNPKEIDWFDESIGGKPPQLYRTGIYRIEGESLTICSAANSRPTDFKTTPEDR